MKLIVDAANEEMIFSLENLLWQVKRGEITQLLTISVDVHGRHWMTRIGNRAELVYALEFAKMKTLREEE